MKDTYSYIAILDFAEDGISIEFPDLPGCLPCAQTQEEALRNAEEAMGLHIYGMEADGEEIPESTPISKIHLEKNQVPALISVYMPLVRQQVKKDQKEEACHAAGFFFMERRGLLGADQRDLCVYR